jgi:hypothetical protein
VGLVKWLVSCGSSNWASGWVAAAEYGVLVWVEAWSDRVDSGYMLQGLSRALRGGHTAVVQRILEMLRGRDRGLLLGNAPLLRKDASNEACRKLLEDALFLCRCGK